jgi:hypothetical protein
MLQDSILAIIALCLLLGSMESQAEAYGSGWYGELQMSYGHEDNISRSFLSSDEVSDDVAAFSIGGGHSQKVSNYGQLVFYGYVSFNFHDEYDDLDSIATSAGMSYTYQPNPGYGSFWYRTDISVTNLNYEDSEAREGVLVNLDLSINRRFGTVTSGHLGYRYANMLHFRKSHAEEERDAAFDTATDEIYLGFDREILPFVYVYGEYAFRHGDAWSNVSSNAGIVEYDAETIDRVFDDCAPDDFRCRPRYAGRTVSDIHRINLGIVFPIKTVNFDVSAVYYDGKGDNRKEYKDWLLTVGLIWNF